MIAPCKTQDHTKLIHGVSTTDYCIPEGGTRSEERGHYPDLRAGYKGEFGLWNSKGCTPLICACFYVICDLKIPWKNSRKPAPFEKSYLGGTKSPVMNSRFQKGVMHGASRVYERGHTEQASRMWSSQLPNPGSDQPSDSMKTLACPCIDRLDTGGKGTREVVHVTDRSAVSESPGPDSSILSVCREPCCPGGPHAGGWWDPNSPHIQEDFQETLEI